MDSARFRLASPARLREHTSGQGNAPSGRWRAGSKGGTHGCGVHAVILKSPLRLRPMGNRSTVQLAAQKFRGSTRPHCIQIPAALANCWNAGRRTTCWTCPKGLRLQWERLLWLRSPQLPPKLRQLLQPPRRCLPQRRIRNWWPRAGIARNEANLNARLPSHEPPGVLTLRTM